MTAVSLLFRYSDFIEVLGGTELQLGWIVGIGAVGSLGMRLFQGMGIDRLGPRLIWLVSLLAVAAALAAHLAISRVDTPAVYLVRVLYHTALAGAFGASITAISIRAPAARMAEVIGMLGSSGFVGMILGSQLGDVLCRQTPLERWHLDRLFIAAALLVLASLACAHLATRHDRRPLKRKHIPMTTLVRRYHPGSLLVMAVVMGMGLGLPNTFLRPFTQALGISQIALFFTAYSITAFVTRIAARRVPDRLGIRPTVLLGMSVLAISMLLYLTVDSLWALILPGVVSGIAHALLFPSVVAGASRAFPHRYRGLGTTLVLGMFDLGNLIGMPLAGTLVFASKSAGLPPYPTMFVTFATIIIAASSYYALASRKKASPVERAEAARESSADATPTELVGKA